MLLIHSTSVTTHSSSDTGERMSKRRRFMLWLEIVTDRAAHKAFIFAAGDWSGMAGGGGDRVVDPAIPDVFGFQGQGGDSNPVLFYIWRYLDVVVSSGGGDSEGVGNGADDAWRRRSAWRKKWRWKVTEAIDALPPDCRITYEALPDELRIHAAPIGLWRCDRRMTVAIIAWILFVACATVAMALGSSTESGLLDLLGEFAVFTVIFIAPAVALGLYLFHAVKRRGTVTVTTEKLRIETQGPFGRQAFDRKWSGIVDVTVGGYGRGSRGLFVSLTAGKHQIFFTGRPRPELEWMSQTLRGYLHPPAQAPRSAEVPERASTAVTPDPHSAAKTAASDNTSGSATESILIRIPAISLYAVSKSGLYFLMGGIPFLLLGILVIVPRMRQLGEQPGGGALLPYIGGLGPGMVVTSVGIAFSVFHWRVGRRQLTIQTSAKGLEVIISESSQTRRMDFARDDIVEISAEPLVFANAARLTVRLKDEQIISLVMGRELGMLTEIATQLSSALGLSSQDWLRTQLLASRERLRNRGVDGGGGDEVGNGAQEP